MFEIVYDKELTCFVTDQETEGSFSYFVVNVNETTIESFEDLDNHRFGNFIKDSADFKTFEKAKEKGIEAAEEIENERFSFRSEQDYDLIYGDND